jgi:signal transduction histidine kinase
VGADEAARGAASYQTILWRYLSRVTLAGQVYAWVFAVWKVVAVPSAYPVWFAIGFPGALGVLTIGFAVEHVRGRVGRLWVAGYVWICVIGLAAQPWLWRPDPQLILPPFDNLFAVGTAVAAGVLAFRRAVGLQILIGLLWLVLLTPIRGIATGLNVGLTTSLAAVACSAGVAIMDEALRAMAVADKRSALRSSLDRAGPGASLAELSWRDLVHGRVIAALLAAMHRGEGERSTAASMARMALADLSGVEAPRASFDEWVGRTARQLGLTLDITCAGETSGGGPASGLRSAVAEAMRNVARHSGQSMVRVTARLEPTRWAVSVSDPGQGYDTAARASIRRTNVSFRPWLAAGGSLRVTSQPGRGTTLNLTWTPDGDVHAPWIPRQQMLVAVLALVHTAYHVLMGFGGAVTDSAPFLVTTVGGVTLMGLTVLAMIRPRHGWTWSSVMTVVQVVLLATTTGDLTPSRLWYLAGVTGFAGALAYHGRWRPPAAMLAASFAAALVLEVVKGSPLPAILALAADYLGPAAGLAFAFLAALIQRARAAIRHDAMARAALAEAHLEAESQSQVLAAQNRHLIDVVVPALERLAAGEAVDPQRLAALEAACRDHINPTGTPSAGLALALIEARSRGIRVQLSLGRVPSAALEAAVIGLLARSDIVDLVITDDDSLTSVLARGVPSEACPVIASLLARLGGQVTTTALSSGCLVEIRAVEPQP